MTKDELTGKDGFLRQLTSRFYEGLFSAAEIARLKNTVSLPVGKRRELTCTLFAHELNNFQS